MLSKQKRRSPFFINNNETMIPQKKKSQDQVIKNYIPTMLTSSNQIQQCFNFKIKKLVNSEDPTLAWKYLIPVLKPNQRQLYFITQLFQTAIIDYTGTQFPRTIYIALRNYSGLLNFDGQVTNKVIVLQLNQISTKTQGVVVTRDLLYRSQMVNAWNLGNLRQLKMEVYVDEQEFPLQMPLMNPINVSFKILHVST